MTYADRRPESAAELTAVQRQPAVIPLRKDVLEPVGIPVGAEARLERGPPGAEPRTGTKPVEEV